MAPPALLCVWGGRIGLFTTVAVALHSARARCPVPRLMTPQVMIGRN